ncbi:diguanylate cyclase (GGDEF) domain-containing protein [Desulfocurvibacter africanus PCS]|uniref:Diguanylate cyclase (GGDEF) domain-containing protein n=1 Tax=Desulfocurvibacter africanus PCS TaxID=1262666 RepID=M5PRK1_DESAF|nr:EAL domain-containing protein [Desulfocurvibacter africanus]EMG36992.1 diguanylate cyclase (GGDEF) domain-containing protein [Desulfocurvibacter africanus PCS]
MNLRLRLFLIILAAFLGLAGIYTLVSRHIVLESFASLEKKIAGENAKRAANIIGAEVEYLDRLVKDRAWWDDTCEFVATRDEKYVRSALPKETFIDQQLNAILIYDLQGAMVWGRFFDLETSAWAPVPETLDAALTRHPELVRPISESTVHAGVILLYGKPFIFSCRPILTSENAGPSRGAMLMGRYMTKDLLSGMGERFDLDMRLLPLGGQQPTELLETTETLTGTKIRWRHSVDGSLLRTTLRIDDVFGNPATFVLIEAPREIHALGKVAFVNSMLALCVGGLLLMGVVYALLEQRITSRVVRLSQIADTALKDDEGKLAHLSGSDELAAVSRKIGAMMDSLRESRGFLSTMLDSLDAGVVLIDPHERVIVEANSRAAWLAGVPAGQIVGRSCFELFCTSHASACPFLAGNIRPGEPMVRVLEGPNGASRSILKTVTRVSREGKEYLLETFLDVTEHERTKQSLAESELLYRTIFMNSGAASLLLNEQGVGTMANEGFFELTGLEPEAVQAGLRWEDLFPAEEVANIQALAGTVGTSGKALCLEATLAHASGKPHSVYLTLARVPGSDRGVLSMVDLTEQRRYQHELYNKAYFDQLTGLPNRTMFSMRLEAAIVRARREGGGLAIMLLDLDDFKNVNDTMGHLAGDEMLRKAGKRVNQAVRKDDLVARLGGDEFVVLVERPHDENLLQRMAARLVRAFAEPFHLGDREIFASTSVGVARFPQDGNDAEAVLKNADLAMYEAKNSGKHAYRLFSGEMNARLLRKVNLEAELRKSIGQRRFVLRYQPIVDVASRSIVGMEALLRWIDESGRVVPPSQFMPEAEECGLVVQMDRLALEIACRETLRWKNGGEAPLKLSVNLSAQHFALGGVESMVTEVLAATGFPASRLGLEITETALIKDLKSATAPVLKALSAKGVSISLDDFGTGYSSLAYLKHLPISVLKIDRLFVSDIGTPGSDGSVLVRGMISLAESLGLAVVAEGVETEEQLAFLRSQGCALAQGFLFAPPLTAQAFMDLLSQGLPAPSDLEGAGDLSPAEQPA